MPGPLTLVIPAPSWVPRVVTAGLETVAVRVPARAVTREIIRAAGRPVAAPSANRSGRPSPTTFEMAWAEMDGRVAAILDGGRCEIGIESTVVDVCTPGVFSVLRPGQITGDDIAAHTDRRPAPPRHTGHSPGTRYRHYHPNVPVVIVAPQDWDAAREEARAVCRQSPGVACRRKRAHTPPSCTAFLRRLKIVVRIASWWKMFLRSVHRGCMTASTAPPTAITTPA